MVDMGSTSQNWTPGWPACVVCGYKGYLRCIHQLTEAEYVFGTSMGIWPTDVVVAYKLAAARTKGPAHA